jgi:hypothetical protein
VTLFYFFPLPLHMVQGTSTESYPVWREAVMILPLPLHFGHLDSNMAFLLYLP